MAITRIKNNQITDSTINASSKVADFTITSAKLANSLTYGSDLTITGNLTVNGVTTTIDTVNTLVEDPILLLGSNQTGNPALDIGFIGQRGTSNNVAWVWDESSDEFVAVYTSSVDANTTISISGFANIQADQLTANTLAGNLHMANLSNNSITFTAADKKLSTSGNLTFDGANLTVTGKATVDNVVVDGQGISTVSGNLELAANGDSKVVVASGTELAIADLATNAIVYVGANGELVDSANLTFDGGNLVVVGKATVDNVEVDGTTISAIGAADATLNLRATGNGVIDVGGTTVSNVAEPQTSTDAATKNYVDALLAAVDTSRIYEANSSVDVNDDGNNANIRTTIDGTLVIETLAENTTFSQDVVVTGDATVGNIDLSNANISVTSGNLNLSGNGEVVLNSAAISDLTSGRVVLAGAAGAIQDSANLTFNGTTLTTPDANVTATLTAANANVTSQLTAANANVTSQLTAASAAVSDLTSGRVVLAGTAGEIEDSANLTFDGTTLTTPNANVTTQLTAANANVTSQLTAANANVTTQLTAANANVTTQLTAASAAVSDLTSGRVVLAGTDGAIEDSANLTFNGSNLVVSGKVTVDNVEINGNAITTTGTDEDLQISANGNGVFYVDRTTVISGNLSVLGTTTTVNSTVSTIVDPIMQLGRGANNAALTTDDGKDRGIAMYYFDTTEKASFMGYDNPSDEWRFFSDATITDEEVTGTLGTVNVGGVKVDNITIDSTSVSSDANLTVSSGSNGNIDITPNGTGVTNITNLKLANLDANAVLITNAQGATDTDGNLTFDGANLTVTGKATVDNVVVDGSNVSVATGNLNLSGNGEVVLNSAAVSDLTSGRVVLAGASGAIEDSANLTFNGTDLTMASAKVSDLTSGRVVLAGTDGAIEDSTNLTFDGTVLTVTGNANVTSQLTAANANVTSQATLASAAVSDLTSGRVVLAGAAGEIEDSANLTFNGTTLTTPNANVTSQATLASAAVSDLTSGRVVLAGTAGEIEDSANLTFNGTTLTTPNANVTSQLTAASAAVSDLTSGRVVLAGTAGEIEDSANLTFNGTTLTTPNANVTSQLTAASAAVSDLTSGRVVLAGAAGEIEDSANLTFNGTDLTMASAKVSDLTSGRVVLAGTDGAIEDSTNLTFNGTVLTVTGDANVTANINANNVTATNNVTANTVTSTGELQVTSGANGNVVVNPNGAGIIKLDSDTLVTGNLTVDGTVTYVNSTTIDVVDPVMSLGGGANGSALLGDDGFDRGIAMQYYANGAAKTAFVGWDSSTLLLAANATVANNEVTVNQYGTTRAGNIVSVGATANLSIDGNVIAGTQEVKISSANGQNVVIAANGTANSSTVVVYGNVDFSNTARFSNTTLEVLTANANLNLRANGTGVVDVGNVKISNVAEPTANSDAATKYYVDSMASSGWTLTDGTNSQVVSGGDTLTVNGTANEVTVEVSAVSDAITVGLPDNVTVTTSLTTPNANVTTQATLASAAVSDLTSGRVVLAGTAGEIEDSANLTFNGTILTVTGNANVTSTLTAANANVTTQLTAANANVTSTLTAANANVTTQLTAASAAVSDLTSGRVVLAGTAGELEDSTNLTFDGSVLTVTGNANVTSTLTAANANVTSTLTAANANVTSQATLASAAVSDLTSGRVVLAGTAGEIEDSANLTFNGTTLTTPNANVTSQLTAASAAVSDLTSGRVVLAGTDGAIEDSANLTFNGTTLTTPNANVTSQLTAASAAVSDLTSGRVVLAGTSGEIEDSANLTFDGGNLVVVGKATIDNVEINSNAITTTGADEDLQISANGNGVFYVDRTTVISGNLSVLGTTTTVNSTVSTIVDPIMQLGRGANNSALTSDDGKDRGIAMYYFDTTEKASFMGYDNPSDEWRFFSDATITDEEVTGTLGSINVGGVKVDNITIDGTSVSSDANLSVTSGGNGNIDITPNGTGVTNITNLKLANLDSNAVLITNAQGATDTDGNLTFDGANLTVTGKVTVDNVVVDGSNVSVATGNLNLSGNGEVVLNSAAVSDLTSGRVVLAGASGAIEDSANLTFNGTDLTMASAKVSDLTSGRVVLAGTDGAIEDSTNLTFNGTTLTVTGNANVTTQLTAASAAVSDLTSGRVVLAGTAGEIEDSANLTFNGTTLTVTGNANVTTQLTAASAAVSDLTSGRVVLAGTAGEIEDSANLTFNGTTLTTPNANVTSQATLASAAVSDLTSGRVVLAGTAGEIEDSANLTFNGTDLTMASAKVSDLTSGRVVLAGTDGAIEDSTNLTFDGANLVVSGKATVDNVEIDGQSITVASGNLSLTGNGTVVLNSAAISDLTLNRIVYATTNGELTDSNNLTFDGSNANLTGNLNVAGQATVDNVVIDGTDITTTAAELTINSAGADVNFRVAGDNNGNLLVVDAGTDSVVIGSATTVANASFVVGTTDSMKLPTGTTAQRPTSGVTGMMRFNTSLNQLEFYDNDSWTVAGMEFTVIASDTFNGDGSTVAFTLSSSQTTASCIVSINGVVQLPTTAYGVSGTTLTFTEAPLESDVIEVRMLTTTTTVGSISNGNASAVIEAMDAQAAIQVTGNLVPSANVTYDLGTSANRWNDLYLAGTTIDLGGLQIKNISGTFTVLASDGVTVAPVNLSLGDATVDGGTF